MLATFKSIHLWHDSIHQYQVGLDFLINHDRFCPIARSSHLIAILLYIFTQELSEEIVVIDNQDQWWVMECFADCHKGL